MGEVLDPKWPPASLRVQAIAARTYALRAMAAGGEICADDRCQVYLGQQVEYPAMDKAVSETAGQVLMFARALASTVYSANGGGVSATREEGFGASEAGSDAAYPYLRAAPYPTGDPMPWSVTVGVGDVATRLGYPGQLTGVKVSKVVGVGVGLASGAPVPGSWPGSPSPGPWVCAPRSSPPGWAAPRPHRRRPRPAKSRRPRPIRPPPSPPPRPWPCPPPRAAPRVSDRAACIAAAAGA